MKRIKISVIVPVYKVEPYIKRCIDSLLKQTFEDYEIIVVNDGTPDNSMEYVEKMQKISDRLVVCNRENGGLSAARNTGILQAKGEYIWFCDSDDAIVQDCLWMIYEKMHTHELDMLILEEEEVLEINSEYVVNEYAQRQVEISENIITGIEMLKEMVDKNAYKASACGYVIKKEILVNNQLSFFEGILHEDELFTPIAMALSKRVEYKKWLFYRRYIREGSITTGANHQKRMEGLAIVIKELFQYYEKRLITEEEKETFQKIIMGHMRNFLGESAKLSETGDLLKQNIKEIREIARQKKWYLGFIFEVYVIYVKLRKIMGLAVCI